MTNDKADFTQGSIPVSYTHLDVYKRQELTLKDNYPHGCIFVFTLPLSEVTLNE